MDGRVFDTLTDDEFKRYNRQMSVLGRKMSPNVEIEAIAQMINENNTDWLVGDCDMIVVLGVGRFERKDQ